MNNKLKKDLLKIFRDSGFKQGDVVEYKLPDIFHVSKTMERTIVNVGTKLALLIDGKFKDLEDLTLIEPMVTLSEVLMKLNEGIDSLEKCKINLMDSPQDYKLIVDVEYWKGTMQHLIGIEWQLFKDGKELGLFQQSEKTIKSIQQILIGDGKMDF